MRSPKIIDYLLSKLPKNHLRWCTSSPGNPCACMGCVNHTISREEWLDWYKRHNYCEHCQRFD